MKKLYFRIEEDTELIKSGGLYEEGQQPESHILDDGFVRFKCMINKVSMTLYDGGTAEEIAAEKTPSYMVRLQNTVTDLRLRAKGAAIGKSGANGYILAQVEFYEIKYQQCISENNSQEIEYLLQNEAEEFGITLEQFKALVILRYEEARDKYNLFMRMIERCRTKIQTLIENSDWENVETAFVLVSTLNNVDQAQLIMEEILSL